MKTGERLNKKTESIISAATVPTGHWDRGFPNPLVKLVMIENEVIVEIKSV
ncbi:MAG: hypothetical protein K8T10_16420 [Candidatus Eremiobacteraeota bacterium]|nr:hypothetical protein [Candidatus Eremiobacteraeota bacterium]